MRTLSGTSVTWLIEICVCVYGRCSQFICIFAADTKGQMWESEGECIVDNDECMRGIQTSDNNTVRVFSFPQNGKFDINQTSNLKAN